MLTIFDGCYDDVFFFLSAFSKWGVYRQKWKNKNKNNNNERSQTKYNFHNELTTKRWWRQSALRKEH